MTDFSKATNAMCMIMLDIMGVFKIVFLWFKTEKLKSLFNIILNDFWPYDLINESKRRVKDMFNLMNIFVVWFMLAGVMFALLSLSSPLFSNKQLPYDVRYPFDWTVSPWYEIIYCMQTFTHGITMTTIGIGAIYMVIGILLSISSQYCILEECFEIFNTPEMYSVNKKLRDILNDGLKNKYTDERREYFVRCVKHHQLLLRFTKELNDELNPLELFELALSIFALCLGSLRIANAESLGSNVEQAGSYLYLIGYTMQLFIDCFFGTFLYHQASLLPDAIFHSNWRTLDDEELRKDFVFLLQNSQRIPQINAYNLYDMHMVSFIKVIKVAFSFYTMLSTLK
ncbi:odorant receptor 83a-like [Diabrotica virgifera virgifera]|uniref:Odorant receptor n=1 Tax=Diabrotica virgifera virgifera TaxID=50390 RepID=A0ABM5K5K7_DIAVI|nr:odorant receptor 83a-like [Diabrotica virgifera virgifera]